MTDYLLLFFTLISIPLAELYLRLMLLANKSKVIWKKDLYRISFGILFSILVLGLSIVLASNFRQISITDSIFVSAFLPLFNFTIYIAVNWKRSKKILGPQRPLPHKD